MEEFERAYVGELANELGNAVQRTVAMIQKYQQGTIGNIPPAEHDTKQYRTALEKCQFDKALDEVWEQVRGLNQYIDTEKPWEIARDAGDEAHLGEVLAYQASCLIEIADLLEPFMPVTATTIRNTFSEGILRPSAGTLFPKHEDPKQEKTDK
jgi:methionyl-tRNA synthetase